MNGLFILHVNVRIQDRPICVYVYIHLDQSGCQAHPLWTRIQ